MTNSANQTSRLGQLILVRLLAAGAPPTRSVIDKSLKRYFANRLSLSDGAWRELLDNTLVELVRIGLLEEKPYRLTASGQAAALQFLGVDSLPSGAKWQTICNRYVIAKVLGIEPQGSQQWQQIGSSAGVRAAVLVKHYRLPIGPLATPSQALHALAWQQLQTAHELAVPTGKRFTHLNVLAATVMKGQSGKPDERLPALISGAKRNHPDAVREAVICNWLSQQESREVEVAKFAPHDDGATAFDLNCFVRDVHHAAEQVTGGRFGENKVFIGRVWEHFQQHDGDRRMTREEFDRHLVDANRENLLTLSRADLVGAMDPQDVQSSEIKLPYASFHFIRTDQ